MASFTKDLVCLDNQEDQSEGGQQDTQAMPDNLSKVEVLPAKIGKRDVFSGFAQGKLKSPKEMYNIMKQDKTKERKNSESSKETIVKSLSAFDVAQPNANGRNKKKRRSGDQKKSFPLERHNSEGQRPLKGLSEKLKANAQELEQSPLVKLYECNSPGFKRGEAMRRFNLSDDISEPFTYVQINGNSPAEKEKRLKHYAKDTQELRKETPGAAKRKLYTDVAKVPLDANNFYSPQLDKKAAQQLFDSSNITVVIKTKSQEGVNDILKHYGAANCTVTRKGRTRWIRCSAAICFPGLVPQNYEGKLDEAVVMQDSVDPNIDDGMMEIETDPPTQLVAESIVFPSELEAADVLKQHGVQSCSQQSLLDQEEEKSQRRRKPQKANSPIMESVGKACESVSKINAVASSEINEKIGSNGIPVVDLETVDQIIGVGMMEIESDRPTEPIATRNVHLSASVVANAVKKHGGHISVPADSQQSFLDQEEEKSEPLTSRFPIMENAGKVCESVSKIGALISFEINENIVLIDRPTKEIADINIHSKGSETSTQESLLGQEEAKSQQPDASFPIMENVCESAPNDSAVVPCEINENAVFADHQTSEIAEIIVYSSGSELASQQSLLDQEEDQSQQPPDSFPNMETVAKSKVCGSASNICAVVSEFKENFVLNGEAVLHPKLGFNPSTFFEELETVALYPSLAPGKPEVGLRSSDEDLRADLFGKSHSVDTSADPSRDSSDPEAQINMDFNPSTFSEKLDTIALYPPLAPRTSVGLKSSDEDLQEDLLVKSNSVVTLAPPSTDASAPEAQSIIEILPKELGHNSDDSTSLDTILGNLGVDFLGPEAQGCKELVNLTTADDLVKPVLLSQEGLSDESNQKEPFDESNLGQEGPSNEQPSTSSYLRSLLMMQNNQQNRNTPEHPESNLMSDEYISEMACPVFDDYDPGCESDKDDSNHQIQEVTRDVLRTLLVLMFYICFVFMYSFIDK